MHRSRDGQSGRSGSERRSLARDESGATTLEWALLLAAVGLPSYYIFQAALGALVGHYELVTTLHAMPLP